MKIAVYARYSSELQDERSIEDQISLCNDHAARRLGGAVTKVYADYAISGAHIANRPEVNQLLEDAAARKFDVVLAEDLDRISRDQEHIASIFKRLTFAGVRIHTVADGDINEMHIGLKGTMSALFLKNLALKVKRGLTGRVKEGRHPGGRTYGYDITNQIAPDGSVIRGKRRINPEQAEVIKRIFREYNAGRSTRQIARDLNKDKIPGPTGKEWTASTINGNRQRRHGFLYTELYAGFLIYNRVHMVKDPATGRRLSRPNPPEEWIVTEVPDLAIIDRAEWDAAQARKEANNQHCQLNRTHRPKHPLSGLVKCGICGGSYTIVSKDAMACSAARERGTCHNKHRIKMPDLQKRVFDGITGKLISPDALEAAMTAYHQERTRLRKIARSNLKALTKRRTEISHSINNIVNAIASGHAPESLTGKLIELEGELKSIEAELNVIDSEDNVVEIHPNAVREYKRMVKDLTSALRSAAEPHRSEAIEIIRGLIDHIEVFPTDKPRVTDVQVYGILDEIKNLAGLASGEVSVQRTVSLVAE
ncbi:recombinase family protein, partial [Thalassospira sp. MCCC 1A01148]